MFLKNSLLFLSTLYRRFFDDGCTYRAAALTYTTLLSLVPLLTVSFAIFSAFPVFKALSAEVQNFIFSHFVATSGEIIQVYINNFIAQTKNLSLFGTFFLVITAVLMMFNMEVSFNAIWKVRNRKRNFSTFLLYWAVLTLTPILLGLSLVLTAYINSLNLVKQIASIEVLHNVLLVVTPLLLSTTTFTILYIAVPNCEVRFRNGLISGFVAAILFEIAKRAFGYYVKHFPSYTLLYGTLATIPIFLVWLYILWVIILFGAILSNVLSINYHYRSEKYFDPFTHAFHWLGHFFKAQQVSKSLSLHELIDLDQVNYRINPYIQLELLQQAGLIRELTPGRYVLAVDLTQFTFEELIERLPWRLPNQSEQDIDLPWEQKLYDYLQKKPLPKNVSMLDFYK